MAVTPSGKAPISTVTGPSKRSRAMMTPKRFFVDWSRTTPGEVPRRSSGGEASRGLTVRFSRLNAGGGPSTPGLISGTLAVTVIAWLPSVAFAPACTSISPVDTPSGRVRVVAVTPSGKAPDSSRTGPAKWSRAMTTPKRFLPP